jgi:hypothetical protein
VHHPETGEELKPADQPGPFALGTVEVSATPPGAQADLAGLQPGDGATFGEAIRLAGYSATPSELKPGEPLTLETLWQTVRPPSETYTPTLQWVDNAGTVRGESATPPVHGNHPTSSWTAGEWVRDRAAMIAPAGLSSGVYEIRLGWTGADGRPLDLRRGLWPAGQFMPVATVRVTERTHRYEPPAPAGQLEADFAGQARLVGYDLTTGEVRPGETLPLTLYWLAPGSPRPVPGAPEQAPRQMASSYKVFVHLIDGNGQIVAQRDSVPARGDRPTTSWVPGEFIADGYTLDLPASLPPGNYALWIGLYDPVSGVRLSLAPSGADRLHLADVQVGN